MYVHYFSSVQAHALPIATYNLPEQRKEEAVIQQIHTVSLSRFDNWVCPYA